MRRRVVFATSHARCPAATRAMLRDELLAGARRRGRRAHARGRPGRLRNRLGALWAGARAGYRIATSRVVVVDDYFFPLYVVEPRDETTVVQAWHGCGAFKQLATASRTSPSGPTDGCWNGSGSTRTTTFASSRRCRSHPHYAEAFHQPLDDPGRISASCARTSCSGEERIE